MEDKKHINEDGEGAVGTTTGSVLGDPGSPTYGGYIGPLGRISRKKLNSRLFNTWQDGSVKNSAGTGKLVTAPQGYVKEHVYSIEGKMVTESNLNDWFGADLKQKPSWNGGKLVTIEPKCLAFPYCSQGAIDKPIKLIGETKDTMCPNCYEYCSHVANETKKTPEAIAKIIRERYLREMIKLDESRELKNKKQTINEMNNLSNLSVSEMRSAMYEMMKEKSDCLYEVLVQEGFLSEELNEGGTYENQCSTLMEDDQIMCEMYKSCVSNESQCGSKMQSYLGEKLIGGQKELDKNHDGKISGADFEMMRKDEGVEHAEEGGSRYMFFSNLELIKHHVEEMMAMDPSKIESILENGHDWAADHIATAKESIDQVFDFLTVESEEGTGEVDMSGAKTQPAVTVIGFDDEPMMENEDDDDDDDQESPTYLLKMKKVLDDKISKYSKYVSNFTPMVAKLDASTMNQYYNTELQGVEYTNENFMDFLTKKEDESSVEYYSRLTKLGTGYPDVFSGLVEPRKRGYFAKFGDSIGFETLDVMEDVLSDIFDMKNSIYTTKSKIDSIEMGIEDRNANKELDTTNDDDEISTKFSPEKISSIDSIIKADELGLYDDPEDRLEEGNLPTFKPVVGKNTTSTNKTESNKENKEATTDAEKSQDSVEQKVDNLKNQKHTPNEFEKDVAGKLNGWRNNLDLDYRTEMSKEQKDRVLDQAEGNAPDDHANVVKTDTGKNLINAAKERSKDPAINANDYSSSHDRTAVEKNQGYVKTTVFNEETNKDIERMKAMFGYEKKMIEENKLTKALNETEILYKKISNKKFI